MSERREDEPPVAFGYASTLFREDVAAQAVNNGQTLVQWKENADLTLDR
jgi:hypothetical protein